MRDLLGHRPAGAVLVGVAEENRGRILRANSAFASLVATTPDALVGSRLCDHIHPAERARALAGFLRLIGGARSSLHGNCSLVTADGVARPVSGYASLLVAGSSRLVVARFLPVAA
jgi:PAS domain-containing protein